MFYIGCPRNSVDMEFRMFFVLPYLPYSVRNRLKFRGIPCHRIGQNFPKFREISPSKCCGILQNFAEFRILLKKIPYFAGSRKTTSVDPGHPSLTWLGHVPGAMNSVKLGSLLP